MSLCPNVIIIGAGAAGVAAATRLLENGISDIIVLEAENRIGGRIKSVDFGGSVVDLGGQWCHGEENNIVYQLAKNLNVLAKSHNNYQDNTYYLSNGTVLNKQLTDQIFQIAQEVFLDEEAALASDGTFGDYFVQNYTKKIKEKFAKNPEALNIGELLLEWFHKFSNGLDGTKTWLDISPAGQYVYKDCEGDLQWNWKDKGFRTILYILMKKIPDITQQLAIDDKIFLNKEVNRIIWNDHDHHGVTVDCCDGSSYNADHVIVTVSLGVLKNNLINSFIPELPQFKRNAIKTMSIGGCDKILLKFPKVWWPNDLKGFSFVWSKEDSKNLIKEFPEGPSNDGKSWLENIYGFYPIDSHSRVLLGWVVGTMLEEIEQLPDDVVLRGSMFLLRKFVGKRYRISEPDAILRTKWMTDPHFYGAYSYVGLEAEKANISSDDLAQPLVSNSSKQAVLFAGEATHPHYFSTVHGAIESGFREADRIINIYKSQPVG